MGLIEAAAGNYLRPRGVRRGRTTYTNATTFFDVLHQADAMESNPTKKALDAYSDVLRIGPMRPLRRCCKKLEASAGVNHTDTDSSLRSD